MNFDKKKRIERQISQHYSKMGPDPHDDNSLAYLHETNQLYGAARKVKPNETLDESLTRQHLKQQTIVKKRGADTNTTDRIDEIFFESQTFR